MRVGLPGSSLADGSRAIARICWATIEAGRENRELGKRRERRVTLERKLIDDAVGLLRFANGSADLPDLGIIAQSKA